MSQDTMLQILIILFVMITYVISIIRKSSNKQESKPSIKPPRARSSAPNARSTSLKPQETATTWRKENPSYTLRKNPISRAKKALNRSLLKKSILTSEILHKKY